MSNFDFVLHPGYIHGLGINSVYVAEPGGYECYFVRKTGDDPALNPGNILGAGYVISKGSPCVRFMCNGDKNHLFEVAEMDFPHGYINSHHVWRLRTATSLYWYMYSNIIDTRDMYYNPDGKVHSNRYYTVGTGYPLKDITFDSEIIYKNEDGSTLTVKLYFPCWVSSSLIGVYRPLGGAKGNITVGNIEVQDDGSEMRVLGNRTKTVYVGGLPVWR